MTFHLQDVTPLTRFPCPYRARTRHVPNKMSNSGLQPGTEDVTDPRIPGVTPKDLLQEAVLRAELELPLPKEDPSRPLLHGHPSTFCPLPEKNTPVPTSP